MPTTPGISARGVRRRFGRGRGGRRHRPRGAARARSRPWSGPTARARRRCSSCSPRCWCPTPARCRVGGHDPVTEPDAVRALLGWSPDVFGVYDNLTAAGVPRVLRGRLPAAEAAATGRAPTSCSRRSTSRSTPTRRCTCSRAGRSSDWAWPARSYTTPRCWCSTSRRPGWTRAAGSTCASCCARRRRPGRPCSSRATSCPTCRRSPTGPCSSRAAGPSATHSLTDLPQTQRRPWRIKAIDNVGLVAALDAMRMPHSEPGPTGVEVELGSEEEAADVIVALVRAGVRVVAIAPSGGDLKLPTSS